jgi:F-type H+-transporting ATPase subunit gamma
VGALVLGTDQGMVGSLNDKVVSLALETLEQEVAPGEQLKILVCGERALALLEAAGLPVEASLTLPGSAEGILHVVQDMLLHLEGWHAAGGVSKALVFYSQQASGASYEPRQRRLLPLDQAWFDRARSRPWPNKALPAFTMDRDRLISALVRQRLLIMLYRALAEALASEHASRLAAMHGAEKNIGERLEELRALYHQQRQKAIDEELMDISAGFEALLGGFAR